MNANSKQPAPTINLWLASATDTLTSAGISTGRLDAELLLAHELGVNRTWLIAHQNDNITDSKVLDSASKMLEKRSKRVPLAYLTNHKEFYNRSFYVDESVLIPRPESEMIIDLLKELLVNFEEDVAAGQPSTMGAQSHRADSEKVSNSSFKYRLVDIGTGSGSLGITAKLEIPALLVTLSDISPDALAVAHRNAELLNADIEDFVQSDLLAHWADQQIPLFDIIIANLPYVDTSWERSPETDHEPRLALFAEDGGLALIKKCVQQASILTSVNGFLLLEADPEQHAAIEAYCRHLGFYPHKVIDYIVVLQRR